MLEERLLTAKRAPEALAGLEWVVSKLGRTGLVDRGVPGVWISEVILRNVYRAQPM